MNATLQLEFQWQLATKTSVSSIARNSRLVKKEADAIFKRKVFTRKRILNVFLILKNLFSSVFGP